MSKNSIFAGLFGPVLIVASTILFNFLPDKNGGLGFVLLLLVYPGILITNLILVVILKISYKEKFSILKTITLFLLSAVLLITFYLVANYLNSPA